MYLVSAPYGLGPVVQPLELQLNTREPLPLMVLPAFPEDPSWPGPFSVLSPVCPLPFFLQFSCSLAPLWLHVSIEGFGYREEMSVQD